VAPRFLRFGCFACAVPTFYTTPQDCRPWRVCGAVEPLALGIRNTMCDGGAKCVRDCGWNLERSCGPEPESGLGLGHRTGLGWVDERGKMRERRRHYSGRGRRLRKTGLRKSTETGECVCIWAAHLFPGSRLNRSDQSWCKPALGRITTTSRAAKSRHASRAQAPKKHHNNCRPPNTIRKCLPEIKPKSFGSVRNIPRIIGRGEAA